jgi:NADH:ubiquinone oxidoreductase subunit 5 (subunit L)/multisubunit Na+/H+ antiporter MnhA subunit
MPLTCALMCLGALGLAGMPFLSGFIGKTMLEESALGAGFGWLVPVIVLSSTLTVAGMARLLWRVFGPGAAPRRPTGVDEAPLLMWLPMALLVAGSVLVGCLPKGPVLNIAWPAAYALSDRQAYVEHVLRTDGAATFSGERANAWERENPPLPTDFSRWGNPLIVLASGLGLAFLTLRQPFEAKSAQWVVYAARQVTLVLRHWHTGLVGDYALWNALGTALLLSIMLLLGRGG